MTALRLFLMRHGKSDWSADYGHDRDRPLAKRGIQAARQMGECLAEGKQLPELIVSSTALRARRTADVFVAGTGGSIPIQQSDHFYESTPQRVLAEVQAVEAVMSVMVVGHEPTWSMLASQLIGGGELAFPTAAIARIDFDCDRWSQVKMGRGLLKWLLQPKLVQECCNANA